MREREGNERKVECERKGHEWLLALAAGDRSEAAWATWGKKDFGTVCWSRRRRTPCHSTCPAIAESHF